MIKKLRSGDLLIQVTSETQATTLSKCTKICSFEVTVMPHKSLNTSWGVISEFELLNDAEDMIKESLQDQHVVEVRRIRIRRDEKLIPTKHLILTFDTPTLPPDVKIPWFNCPVRPYVPNPLRCFQCQRFGHSKASCRGTSVCVRCSSPGHSDTYCELSLHCINCKGDHAAYSRNCPRWSREKEIQSVKVSQNLTFQEAHRIVSARTPRPGTSYSMAAKISYCTVSTQTDTSTSFTSQQTKQKSQFNFTGPSTSRRPVSKSPPPKTSRTLSPEKSRPALKQRSSIKLPPSLKPGLTKKKKDPKFSFQSASDALQKMDDSVTLHPSDDESIFDDSSMDVSLKPKPKIK
ncbi:uncharacterized protein [Parasteatoda tepidariorum]|uniref:uncharacterized protein n=1 Tax=Parasteatoda tepidariorum TaxID=114398 RepID=UPI00077FDE3B|nr:uncharacterized protein LOC107453426 [Parasteatoda tepidariorum]